MLVLIRGVDINVAALLQRVHVQGLATNATGAKLTSTFNSMSRAASQFGVALGVGAIANGALELARLGAQAEQTALRFDQAARAAGTTGEAMTVALRAASASTISDLNLQLATNRARLLGVADSAETLAPLLAIARDRSQEMGIATTQAFNDLVTGLGRGSPLILDNLGITLSVAEANQTYADALGKTVAQLTDQEQKQALINAVLEQGKAALDAHGGAVETSASRMERATASVENFTAALGQRLAPAVATVADGLANLLTSGDLFAGAAGGSAQAQATITAQAASYEAYVARIAAANQQLRDEIGKTDPAFALLVRGLDTLSPSQFAYAQSLIATGTAQAEAVRQAQALVEIDQILGGAQQTMARESDAAGASFEALQQQMLQLAATGPEAQAGVLALIDSLLIGETTLPQFTAALQQMAAQQEITRQVTAEAAREQRLLSGAHLEASNASAAYEAALRTQGTALVDATQKTLEGAIQAENLSKFQELLAQLGGDVANGFTTAGNAATVLAGQYNIASSAAVQLINLQAQLAQSRVRAAADADFRAGERSGGQFRSAADQKAFSENARAQAKAADEAAAAATRYQAALGKFGPAITRANQELANIPKGTAAYYDKLIEIQGLKERQLAGGRKAAGAAQVSDQARLNNTLLADQDRANDQLEAAARAHGQRMLDIEERFQKASLEQQRANELSKRQSELDFLKAITGSELNATREGRAEITRINEQYYRDFAAAQEAAQAGNLKQSEELAAQAKHRADVELQYAEQIDKARKDKNRDEEARLIALRERERQLLAEQEKQIIEGGDPNVKARQEALDEEQRNFAEQQGKIGDAADAAAQRKIDAALRSGKAIEAENLRLQQQEAIINRIGAKQPTPAPSSGTPAPVPATAAPISGTPIDLAALADVMRAAADQISAAIASASGEIVRAEQGTTRAVSSLSHERLVY